MPACSSSPWCECGTRYDGGLVIYCDQHPPLQEGEALFANEIYVNGNRWYLAKDADPDAPRRSASQAEEDELAQRFSGSTAASVTQRDADGSSQITQVSATDYHDKSRVVTESATTLEYHIPDDLRDVDIDESLFARDTDLEDNVELYDVSDIDNDSDNGELSEVGFDHYYTPPTSPSQINKNATFNITHG